MIFNNQDNKMKKIFLLAILPLGLLAIAIGINSAENRISDLMLINAEALANGEGSGKGPSWEGTCDYTDPKTGYVCSSDITFCLAYTQESCTQKTCSDHQK